MTHSNLEENLQEEIKSTQPVVEKRSFSPILIFIGFYQQYISPLLGQNCRFMPSCSQYMVEAITEHGHLKGSYLGCKRICKCHPWNEGGYDPVPKKH